VGLQKRTDHGTFGERKNKFLNLRKTLYASLGARGGSNRGKWVTFVINKKLKARSSGAGKNCLLRERSGGKLRRGEGSSFATRRGKSSFERGEKGGEAAGAV